MIIDQQLLDTLFAQAKANPRLRQAYDLRTTPEDKSQQILNAVESDAILPIYDIYHSGKVVHYYITIFGTASSNLYKRADCRTQKSFNRK